MEDLGDPVERYHSLSVVLPSGLEKTATVHGSKPVMDLLVTLCARYHLNPSDHTVEVLSHNKNHISFKPNYPIGSLEAETIVLKAKVAEDKARRPYTPEVTVRLLVNYRKSHKTVVRVNPRVPLGHLALVISEKCEFQLESTVLLRDSLTQEPLDLTKSLNDLGIRELFAKDMAGKLLEHFKGPVEGELHSRNEKKRRGNNGFLSLFRRKKDKDGRAYAPAPQDLKTLPAVSASSLGLCSASTSTAGMTKKRPAPRPPMIASRSVPDNLSGHRVRGPQSSAESTSRRTKRRAPLPPRANSHPRAPADAEGGAGISNSICKWELGREHDSVNTSGTGSPLLSSSSSSSSLTISSLTQLLPQPQEEGLSPHQPKTQHAYKELSHVHSAKYSQILNPSLSNGKPRSQCASAPFSKSYDDDDDQDDSITHEPSLAPKYPFGSRCGSDLHPEQWEDFMQRKGMTTFKVVPSKSHRYHEVRDETSSAAELPGHQSLPDTDPEEVQGEVEASPSLQDSGSHPEIAEVDQPSPEPEVNQDKEVQSCAESEEVLDIYEEMVAVEEGEVEEVQDEEVHSTEVEEEVHDKVMKDEGVEVERVQKEEIQEEEEYDEVPVEDEEHFPPPPPPISYDDQEEEEVPGEAAVERSTLLQPPPSSSSPALDSPGTSTSALSILRKVSEAPSRFAQAVALAVQRTHLAQTQGPDYSSTMKARSRPDAVPAWLPQSSVNSGSCLG